MADKIFVDAMRIYRPKPGDRDFVKARVWVPKVDELVKFLHDHAKGDGSVNFSILESKNEEKTSKGPTGNGNAWYFELDQWAAEKPAKPYEAPEVSLDDLPF